MEIKTGIYPDLTNEQYHASSGISKSGLAILVEKTPLHYWAAYLDPDREPRVETKAFKIGAAGHKLILEPEDFDNEYAVLPQAIDALHGATKIKKEYIEKLENKGLTDLKISEYKDICKMAQRVKDHPEAGVLLSSGKAEQSFYWIDPDTGVLCKCRPDYWIPDIVIPDYKTTKDARDDKFSRSCADFTYHIQAAFYSDGVAALTGEQLNMPFIAQEKESPYALNVFWIDPPDVSMGRDQYKRALDIYAECVENDNWPGYKPTIRTISLPRYYKK